MLYDLGYCTLDLGRAKENTEDRYRARQNVVFEHGYLMSKLGRNCVAALVKGDIETPGDLGGMVYIPMDKDGFWKVKLATPFAEHPFCPAVHPDINHMPVSVFFGQPPPFAPILHYVQHRV